MSFINGKFTFDCKNENLTKLNVDEFIKDIRRCGKASDLYFKR